MKPKVLIVTKFYYPRGGACVCAIDLERLLRLRGYDVAVFAMNYPENLQSRWSPYFADNVCFWNSNKNRVKAVKRVLGFGDIRSSFAKIMDDFNPDIVHLHNIHSYISPEVAVMAHKRGKKVVWTLHDYKLVCPAYSCLYNGKPCDDCIIKSKFSVVRKKCMKGAFSGSFLGWLEALRWRRPVLEKNVDAFVCPSRFMKEKMIQGGFEKGKLHVICNFIGGNKFELLRSSDPMVSRDDYCCYVGRLSHEKGVDLLLSVMAKLPYKIKIAGSGPEFDRLKEIYASDRIEFLGKLDADGVLNLLKKSRFSIVPSICYENNPLSAIESFCTGTPVVGANIGGIPELIDEGTGLIFESGNSSSLEKAIHEAFSNKWDYRKIQEDSLVRFSAENYYGLLEKVY